MKEYSFAKLVVRGFPTMTDLRNPYIYTSDIRVVVNVSESAYPKEIEKELSLRGIKTYHFPLVEEGTDMGLNNILKAVRVLVETDRAGEKVLLHCFCGNNRSRTVAEAYYYLKTGEQFEDEYKGYMNHLVYNCESGHLPSIESVEETLSELKKEPYNNR